MRVIINADDFGYNKQVNDAIEEAIKERKISSTTIIANSPCVEEAIAIAKKYDYISYGVHLNLVEFEPLTNKEVFSRFKVLNSKGNFIEGAILCLEKYPTELKQAIKEEWIAQINKIKSAGINISHIDSHQHTHCLTELQDILIDVLLKFKITRCRRRGHSSIIRIIRSRKYQNPKYDKSNAIVHPKRNIIFKVFNHFILLPYQQKKWLNNVYKIANLPDDIVNYQWFVQDIQRAPLSYYKKTIEIECHPGLSTNIDETYMLMHDEIRKIVYDYSLINYYEL